MRRIWRVALLIISITLLVGLASLRRQQDPILALQPHVHREGFDFVSDEAGYPIRLQDYALTGLRIDECKDRLRSTLQGWRLREDHEQGSISFQNGSPDVTDAVNISTNQGNALEIMYTHRMSEPEIALAWIKNGFKSPYVKADDVLP